MSTNGWGKGSVNNSNGWGAGAINNDIGWGDSQLKSWSGDTDIDGGTGIPVNTVAPVISGTTTLGSVLTTTNGTWTAKPAATFTYQWKRNGLDIDGATNSTYTLVNEDGASNIFCKVTATNEFGSASANSNTLVIPSYISYILDTYPATAAYSLRKLRTAYTGAAIRVRRSSDNAEQDIGFVGNNLDTASLLSFVGAGDGFVNLWYDQQGVFNVVQAGSTGQPRIVNAGTLETKGGLPAVKFDGSNDSLDRIGLPFLNTTSMSYFSVSAAGATGISPAIFSQSSLSNNSIRTFCDSRLTPNRNLFITNISAISYAADLSTARVDTNQRLLSSFIDASKNMSAFDNGAIGGTDTYVGTINNNGLTLGRQTTSYGNIFIQEFIAYNTDESANRIAIESNINTYYGIY